MSSSGTTTTQEPTAEGGEADNMGEIASLELECPICLQACIHPVELPCHHIFCFLCIKGVAMQGQSRCAICRAPIPHSVLTHPRLKDVSQLYKHTKADHEWFYEARGGGWWQYDERSMQELDRAYETGSSSCQLLIAGHVYEIDFSQMLQYRSNNRNLSRRIKRDVAQSEKRGVAGIRVGTGSSGGGPESGGGGDANANNRRVVGRRGGGTAASGTAHGNSSQGHSQTSAAPVNGGDNGGSPSSDAGEDDGDEGVDSDDPDYLGEEEDDEMDLGEEDEEDLEESEPSEEEEEVELRDGARAPTRRSDRSTSSNNQTPPPSSGGSGRTSSSAAVTSGSVRSNGSSSSPQQNGGGGRSSTGRGRRSQGRLLSGGNNPTSTHNNNATTANGLTASAAASSAVRSGTSSSASTSPSPLGDAGGIKTLGTGNNIRLSPAPNTEGTSNPTSPTSAPSLPSVSPTTSGSSITTTSGITCLVIGPGVRITLDREGQQRNGGDYENEEIFF
ncbi:E3 ubiquitin-protein ligase rnf146 isoform X2 [Folsomia candida]|uniref:E3 ubiquitin-protein ligase rnf146 isoform X2 n=1 Tax=Folsomia candida TaxID=158441 RepID=UPI000B8FEF75|nr:E3 ubiquitin-protein ligase rnf146 isoform X2 [Folsomia candida]